MSQGLNENKKEFDFFFAWHGYQIELALDSR